MVKLPCWTGDEEVSAQLSRLISLGLTEKSMGSSNRDSIVSLLNFNRLGRGGEKLLMPSFQAMAAKFSNFS